MASKLNTEFNYRYQVIGDTPWEKIKTLQGFLEGRVRAAALEEVGNLKDQAKVAKLKHLQNGGNGLEHEILELKAEILEGISHQPAAQEAFELNKKEIKILNKLLKELYVIAETCGAESSTLFCKVAILASSSFMSVMTLLIVSSILTMSRVYLLLSRCSCCHFNSKDLFCLYRSCIINNLFISYSIRSRMITITEIFPNYTLFS